MTGQNPAGVRNALCKHGTELLHHRCDGVGRDKGFADMAHHHRHGVVAEREQRVADEDRNADLEILSHQIAAFHPQMVKAVGNFFIHKEMCIRDRW